MMNEISEKNIGKVCVKITIHGAVQGVGFRPFIFRLAKELDINGWVCNSLEGVNIEGEGSYKSIVLFLKRIQSEKPQNSYIHSFKYVFVSCKRFSTFKIEKSSETQVRTALIMPDISTCYECYKDIFDPHNRRYLYPFTNCTHCGPRFSIIRKLPYDRCNTTMKDFVMCELCLKEYSDPENRRFHAQPNACPVCGPHVSLYDNKKVLLSEKEQAVDDTVKFIKEGKIVVIKGLGGFHLVVDASNSVAVQRLRKLKNREEKPFAIMCPSEKIIESLCNVSNLERQILLSPESPIVLLEKRWNIKEGLVCESVAPGNPYCGIMLPYTPLHHILLAKIGNPIVATSCNMSDEPICFDNDDVFAKMSGVADVFLVHNRLIERQVDDSIVRIIYNRPMVIRRARGYAPLPINTSGAEGNVLALGAHMKNTIALKVDQNIFLSQHIGDLETKQSFESFKQAQNNLQSLYDVSIEKIAVDMHPEYINTKYGYETGIPVTAMQHHHAHILSCMAENQLDGEVFGVVWDGTGYGLDKTIWGGEFLISNLKEFKRFGHFRTFKLPGGDKAVKEPRRTALGILWEVYKENYVDKFKDLDALKSFNLNELNIFHKMLEQNVNCPTTSSVGRLFDAVASLSNLCHYIRFEGQAAMMLEYSLSGIATDDKYSFRIVSEDSFIADWEPTISEIIQDIRSDVNQNVVSIKFHNTLVEIAIEAAKTAGLNRVVLSGGCFQNKYLTERMIARLKEEGFVPYWHQMIPPNDGGISLGQAVGAS